MPVTSVVLGDGLDVPFDIDPKDLKSKIKAFYQEAPVVSNGSIAYKKYKVSVAVDGNRATITNIKKK